jgi:hypothetical protein
MHISFTPADLHLKTNDNGLYVVTVRGEEILATKSRLAAIARFTILREEFEKNFSIQEPSCD